MKAASRPRRCAALMLALGTVLAACGGGGDEPSLAAEPVAGTSLGSIATLASPQALVQHLRALPADDRAEAASLGSLELARSDTAEPLSW